MGDAFLAVVEEVRHWDNHSLRDAPAKTSCRYSAVEIQEIFVRYAFREQFWVILHNFAEFFIEWMILSGQILHVYRNIGILQLGDLFLGPVQKSIGWRHSIQIWPEK